MRLTMSGSPLPYTAAPWKLLWEDIVLFFRCAWLLPLVLFPLVSCNFDELDELYPSIGNLSALAFHFVLIVLQLLFLISLPISLFCMLPALWLALYVAGFLILNKWLCDLILNRGERVLESRFPESELPEHKHERWIFINGVCVGKRWLQQSIDRLGYTFGRKITGVHNPTTGLVFDIIQVLVQRNLCYSTQDVRDAYAIAKENLLDPQYNRVIVIAHSQGGVEASLIVDWLLDEMPQELLRKLEVYTFGNAANHFNNPYRNPSQSGYSDRSSLQMEIFGRQLKATILHIEHYANAEDFVSAWGVLNFASISNRYMGQVLKRPGSGHLFNQHYLDTMFTLGPDRRVLDSNSFMDMDLEGTAKSNHSQFNESKRVALVTQSDGSLSLDADCASTTPLKVKDCSRLWKYRNGGLPLDIES